jgi:hypothetical protein
VCFVKGRVWPDWLSQHAIRNDNKGGYTNG